MKFVKSENDCQQLFFSGGVVELGIIKSFAGITNDMGKLNNSLAQNNTYRVIRSVIHHLKWKILVR